MFRVGAAVAVAGAAYGGWRYLVSGRSSLLWSRSYEVLRETFCLPGGWLHDPSFYDHVCAHSRGHEHLHMPTQARTKNPARSIFQPGLWVAKWHGATHDSRVCAYTVQLGWVHSLLWGVRAIRRWYTKEMMLTHLDVPNVHEMVNSTSWIFKDFV